MGAGGGGGGNRVSNGGFEREERDLECSSGPSQRSNPHRLHHWSSAQPSDPEDARGIQCGAAAGEDGDLLLEWRRREPQTHV